MEFWIAFSSFVETATLILLVGLSVWSVSIVIDRRRVFRESFDEESLKQAKKLISDAKSKPSIKSANENDLVAGTLKTLTDHPHQDAERLERALRSYLADQKQRLEKGLSILATLGSNAPFIGLFGTVLGIIKAFAALADNQAGTASVMSGISLALIATAAGLFVAIPAVVAFNYFSRELQVAMLGCESLRDRYLSLGTTAKK